MKKKMLYMSHVDWNWIKQRPQFLAEGLMNIFDVSVLYMFLNRDRKQLQKRNVEGENDVKPMYTIPLARRLKVLGLINNVFLKAQFAWHIRRVNPTYIFMTYPTQVHNLPRSYSGTLIYDCMDDHEALAPDFLKNEVRKTELELLQRAGVVFVSSENLKRVLMNKYGKEYGWKIHLIRNGYNGKIMTVKDNASTQNDEFTISYIGTIGKWFNFDYILRSLEEIPNLRYKIIGPSEFEFPKAERIEYVGTLEHDKLYDAIKDTDCLSMPFMLNDIVLSVDPVKLYEYINYNKNILCVRYPEVERFEPFVYFYDDYETFIEQIRNMMKDNSIKYDNNIRTQFLLENNWVSRVKEISNILQNN